MRGILGEKVGMTAVFAEDGNQIPVTIVRTIGNRVLGKKTEETDGYNALVMGFGDKRADRANRPEVGFFEKNDLVEEREEPGRVEGETVTRRYIKRHVREFRMNADDLAGFEVGAGVAAQDIFNTGDTVDVVGTSKGRGFTGVLKRHNFSGTKASHGVHEYFRHGGSIGSNTYPAHVFKNKKMPGQHGNKRVTLQNLKLVEVIADEGLLLIKGSIPGPNGGLVQVNRAVKKS